MFKFFFFFWLLSFGLFAQSELSGKVEDENSDPYQHVLVKIEQLNFLTRTDDHGMYTFKNVPSGNYAVSVDYGYDVEYRQVLHR
jgi:hypothetical protein